MWKCGAQVFCKLVLHIIEVKLLLLAVAEVLAIHQAFFQGQNNIDNLEDEGKNWQCKNCHGQSCNYMYSRPKHMYRKSSEKLLF